MAERVVASARGKEKSTNGDACSFDHEEVAAFVPIPNQMMMWAPWERQ